MGQRRRNPDVAGVLVGRAAMLAAATATVALTAALAAPACRRNGDTIEPTGPMPDAERGRFPHDQHAELPCVQCHRLDDVLAGRVARPGTDDHAPCDRNQCHAEEFLGAPGPFCTTCHIAVDPTGAEPTLAAPYPPLRGARALASRFSHQRHLDFARMESLVGFHVSCTDCHVRGEAETDPRSPGHRPCARCHVAETIAGGRPPLNECTACHAARPDRIERERTLIVGDLRFDHLSHETDRNGRPIACVTCHVAIGEVDVAGAHATPPTSACVECHDDDTRTPVERRMRVCETCHLTRSSSFGTLAPKSHFPTSERPEDHTLAFRLDHGGDARANSQRCASCHLGMSGSSRDSCDECHQSMRPRDHTAGWREFDHGPAAGTERDRCATCHVGEFCVACHSRPPRSHFPRLDFRTRGHGELARIASRSCTACHRVELDCTGAGCHSIGPPR